jgi:hypothetical protein
MSLDDRVKGAIDTLLKMFEEENLDKVTCRMCLDQQYPH